MTLSIGLDAALSGLSTAADQTSVVSRNVARAGDASASRKIASLVTLPGGGVKLGPITRATAEGRGLATQIVPEDYTIPALARAIVTHFEPARS